MKIKGKHSWIATCASGDAAQFVKLEPAGGPDGGEALQLTVNASGTVEVREEQEYPIISGRAYLLRVLTRSELERAHGQLFLDWLDSDHQLLEEAWSEYSFARHAFTPLTICQQAPENARFARVVFRLFPDAWPDSKDIRGRLWLASAVFEPSVAIKLLHTVPGALYDAGQPVVYGLELCGAPEGAGSATITYTVTDYDQRAVLQSGLTVLLSSGRAATSVNLPPLGAGYYEVQLQASVEGATPASVVKSFGCLEKLDFNPRQDSPIALDAGISWPFVRSQAGHGASSLPERFHEQAAACYKLGLRTLRDRFDWGQVNPAPGTITWGQYQRSAIEQHAAGLDVYQMISSAPLWALDPSENEEPKSNYPPRDVRIAYDFHKRMATELGHFIRYWEFWNEPDIFFYCGHPWDLAAMTKAGALGIKDADLSLGVLGGSRCNIAEFWRKWLANGVGPYFDIFNQHSYGKPEDLFALIEEDRALMAEFGLERPIWMTEMGQRSTPSADGSYVLAERIQVAYLLRAYACGLAAGVDRFFYFYLQEFLEAGIHLWGIQRQDLSPKPAVLALGALIRQIGRARVIGTWIEDDKYCIVFERLPGEYTAMVWSIKNTVVVSGWDAALPNLEPGMDWSRVEGEFDLPVVPGAYLVDALGRHSTEFKSEVAHIKLSLYPQFLRGIDPTRMTLTPPPPTLHYKPSAEGLSSDRHIFLQARTRPNQPRLKQADAQQQKNALFVQPGDIEQIAWIVHNYSQERVRVTLKLDEPTGWQLVRLQTGDAEPFKAHLVPLELPANSSIWVLADYSLLDITKDKEYCLAGWLYLDGAPHDQVAAYYTCI